MRCEYTPFAAYSNNLCTQSQLVHKAPPPQLHSSYVHYNYTCQNNTWDVYGFIPAANRILNAWCGCGIIRTQAQITAQQLDHCAWLLISHTNSPTALLHSRLHLYQTDSQQAQMLTQVTSG